MTKRLLLGVAALAMTTVGVLHFVRPQGFVRIVPTFLPAPLALVYISGLAEIAGGLGLLWSRTRRLASWGLIALYIAVFPANMNMAVNHLQIDAAHPLPDWVLWARLPFQFAFIALAWWLGRGSSEKE